MARVMGVLNVTPDSFSDGGRWAEPAVAVARARQMVAEGADLVDVGGESTRPGATPVPVDEELRRVVPVVEALAAEGIGPVSVDTRKAEVARAAVAAGAVMINDVSSTLAPVAAELGCAWVAMHSPADPEVMQRHTDYHDVVADVLDAVVGAAEAARRRGVTEVYIDPGIGFGKTGAQNLLLLRHLDRFVATGWPVMIGTSRKSFLGSVGNRPGEAVRSPDQRLEGSVATAAWAVVQGAALVRVHDVRPAAMAVRLARSGREADGAGAGAAGMTSAVSGADREVTG